MNYINFHAHRSAQPGEYVIQDGVHTWGIHPWYASCRWDHVPDIPSLLAIGECGLDKCCQTPVEVQLTAFRYCVGLSEKYQKPLVLHCVRALSECLQIRGEFKTKQPWIWHGFRSAERQMNIALAHGLYLSFGFRYNREALLACPLQRLLLETDEEKDSLEQLYYEVATLRGIPLYTLLQAMWDNFNTIFSPITPLAQV